jgi:hypothetical protein
MKKISVPVDSPAWEHYLLEGWIEIDRSGLWAILVRP